MVFSKAEMQEFDAMMAQSKKDAANGKKPQVSAVLMSLQYATTMPDENGKMWFENELTRMLVCASVKKLMHENTPDMFSVGEKAYMFALLNTFKLLQAIDQAGFDVSGFFTDKDGNRVDDNGDPINDEEEEDEG